MSNGQLTVIDDPETVADRLREAEAVTDTNNLRQFLRGRRDRSSMAYEDWALPVKVVPELCLRAGTWLIDYREPDRLERVRTGGRVLPTDVCAFMDSSTITLEAVLVEAKDDE